MTFDEFNKSTHEITSAYGQLVKWNQKLRARIERLEEQMDNEACDTAYWKDQCMRARELAEGFAVELEDWRESGEGMFIGRPTLPWEEK